MTMVENAPKARGEFTLQVLNDKGEVIDQFQENNLVVNTARESMSALLSGKSNSLGITTFVLGTRGHDETSNDILQPKPVGQNGYDETRTQLFSEQQNQFYYTVKWTQGALLDTQGAPVPFTGNTVQFVAKGQKKNQVGTEPDAENAQIPVKIELQNNAVQYEFEIPEASANGANGQSTVAYTEAGLKCGDKLFSIKCFSGKVKSLDTKFKIIWRIIF